MQITRAVHNNCACLAVDTAKSSGWSVFVGGAYVESGCAMIDQPGAVRDVISGFVGYAKTLGIQPVLILERPTHGNLNTLVGLGGAHGAWRIYWRDLAGRKAPVVSVYGQTWRKRVLGMAAGPGVTRPVLRRAEMATALRLISRAQREPSHRLGHDEAAAICIGHWASFAPEVDDAIHGRKRPTRRPRKQVTK